MPLTTTGRNSLLTDGATSFAYLSATTNIDTTTPTEITTTRQAITWAAAASGQRTNSNAISIPVTAGTTVQGIAIFTASTGGSCQAVFPVGSSGQYVDGVATAATTGTFTSVGHGLTTDDRVFFSAVAGETLPATLSTTTLYFVRSGSTADTFTIATTSGGTAVTFTSGGEAAFFKTVPNTFSSAGNLTVAIGALTLDGTFA